DGATWKPIWEVAFARPQPPGEPPGLPRQDKPAGSPARLLLNREAHGSWYWPRLLKPAPDLNGDGVRDLLFIRYWPGGQVPQREMLWAISGKDGKELWWTHADGRVLGMPALADLDGKRQRDIVATLQTWLGPKEGMQRWIEGFSGATGKSRWRYQ